VQRHALAAATFLLLALGGCGRGDDGSTSLPRGVPSFDAEGQDAACSKAVARLAPGYTYGDGYGFINVPLTAEQTAALLARQGDAAGAAYWRKREPKTLVYTCNFSAPRPSSTPEPPSCPAGQMPVGDDVGAQRVFLVDAEGHSTEQRLPSGFAMETCLPN